MSEGLRLRTVGELAGALGLDGGYHPQFAVVDYAALPARAAGLLGREVTCELYVISVKDGPAGLALDYGRSRYDFDAGSMLFVRPGQRFAARATGGGTGGGAPRLPTGWGLYLDPALLAGTPLGAAVGEYAFFDYTVDEALRLSPAERRTVDRIVGEIASAAAASADAQTRPIAVALVGALLAYAQRFYARQFATRQPAEQPLVGRFLAELRAHYPRDRDAAGPMPALADFAGRLHRSPAYLSDLVRRETGRTVTEHIHAVVVERAQHRLLAPGATVSGTAYGLGFEYPHYFSRVFRKVTGESPTAWRRRRARR